MGAPRIGLSLSGGGARAMAFHLGCLRALEEMGTLGRVKVISTVSGGSVIGALYAARVEPFEVFENRVRHHLARGFVRPALGKAISTQLGWRLLGSGTSRAARRIVRLITDGMFGAVDRAFADPSVARLACKREPLPKSISATTLLQRVFEDDLFDGLRVSDLPAERPLLIVNATELRTRSAFRFSKVHSGSYRFGRLAKNDSPLGYAVAASAAYPLSLSPLDLHTRFEHRGLITSERVVLTDGGVYDNLGLGPLWPDRDPKISLPFPEIDTIIACRAGYGLTREDPGFGPYGRMRASYDCTARRAENASVKRLYDLRDAGAIHGFAMPFLDQNDAELAHPPPNLVPRGDVQDYPTDFSAMPKPWIDRLIRRGEQQTRAVIAQYLPELVAPHALAQAASA
ncbi:patatin-like phospholipase family protein [Jannaschia rubra]|uniref:Patatin-like phospholipase n=1 Tax=Jannaschia rubra TaxID=282197 RepID=A0A0M6XWX7_9RHOB|nr:patatin-like phospholipase family protein [Jannaschia rubra]CTQ34813.1 Patatin-like phospholipase [Jannaschia rubra]SFG67624.1 NTE family protein [Jannaschia rubra]